MRCAGGPRGDACQRSEPATWSSVSCGSPRGACAGGTASTAQKRAAAGGEEYAGGGPEGGDGGDDGDEAGGCRGGVGPGAEEVAAAVDEGIDEALALVLFLGSEHGVEGLARRAVDGVVQAAAQDLEYEARRHPGGDGEGGEAADGAGGDYQQAEDDAQPLEQPPGEKELGHEREDVDGEVDA